MVRHETTWKTAAAERLLATHCRRIPTVGRYCLDVITGNVPTGRMVFLAVERFLNDLARSAPFPAAVKPVEEQPHQAEQTKPVSEGHGDFPYYFDQGAAVSIIKYFRDLCPFSLVPFEQFIVAQIFGWKKAGISCADHPNGHRRFQTAYIEEGKGSGKTPLAAGVGTYGVCADGEPGAEVYVAAPSKEQAAICFRDAVKIVEGDAEHKELKKLFKQHGCSGKMLSGNLSHGTSFMRPVSAEHKTLDGPRPHMVIADELHEHPNTLVLDKLTAGFKARHQPLGFEITNSGWDRETICFYHHEYSRQVLEGIVKNEGWFAYVCQVDVCPACRLAGKEQPSCDDCDSWLDETVWIKANPGLGTILPREYLLKQVKEALEIPATRNLKQRLNFCIWTQSEERFISPEGWRACAWDTDPFVGDPVRWRGHQIELLRGKLCFGGLDIGVVNDFSCLALYFPVQRGVPKPVLLLWSWVPTDVDCHKLLKERYGYDVWVQDKFLKQTPGQRTDYSIVREDILALEKTFHIEELAFDPAYTTQLVQELIASGVNMVEHRQGSFSMTGPIKEFQRQIIGKDFVHGLNPLLTFMVDNLVVKSDGKGNLTCVKPENPNSPRKIDGAVASIMAVGRSAANPDACGSTGKVFFA